MISKNTKHTNWTTLNSVIFIFKNRQYFLSFVHSRHLTGCRSIQFQRETHTMLSQTLTQNLQQTVKYASTFWLMFGKFLIVFDSLWQGCKKAKQSKYEVEHILISFLFLLWRLLVYWFKRLISPITLAWLCILLKCYIVLAIEKQLDVCVLSFNPSSFRMYSDPVTLVSGNKLTYYFKNLFPVSFYKAILTSVQVCHTI